MWRGPPPVLTMDTSQMERGLWIEDHEFACICKSVGERGLAGEKSERNLKVILTKSEHLDDILSTFTPLREMASQRRHCYFSGKTSIANTCKGGMTLMSTKRITNRFLIRSSVLSCEMSRCGRFKRSRVCFNTDVVKSVSLYHPQTVISKRMQICTSYYFLKGIPGKPHFSWLLSPFFFL